MLSFTDRELSAAERFEGRSFSTFVQHAPSLSCPPASAPCRPGRDLDNQRLGVQIEGPQVCHAATNEAPRQATEGRRSTLARSQTCHPPASSCGKKRVGREATTIFFWDPLVQEAPQIHRVRSLASPCGDKRGVERRQTESSHLGFVKRQQLLAARRQAIE